MKILITGAHGYIGRSLCNNFEHTHEVYPITRNVMDLTNSREVRNYFEDTYFDVVIHCASVGGHREDMDGVDVLDNNLSMYFNLLENKEHFGKFINFGSGAELNSLYTPYGLSKRVIRQSILEKENFYNIRIFAVFDENELNSRYIKTNVQKYINGEALEVFYAKKIDFFYMKDLITVVKYYISNNTIPQEFDCTYSETKSLLNIAKIINLLGDYRREINFNNEPSPDYCGNYYDLGLKYVGMEEGIVNTYNKLKITAISL